MNLRSIGCPTCEATHQFYLSADDDRHLRRCPDCGRWLVAAVEEPADDGLADLEVTGLDDPPECPVEGCSERPPAGELPAHVIAVHDGVLSAE